MTALKLHVSPGSSPCRSVLLTLKALGDDAPELEVVHVDLKAGEHMTDEFLALNPRHCVPTLETSRGGTWESRSIMRYLVALAGGNDLYPSNLEHRAEVDRLLDWDLGTFYKAIGGVVYTQIFHNGEPTKDQVDTLREVLHFLDNQLQGLSTGVERRFLTGDHATLADLSIGIGLTMLELVDFEIDHPRVKAWQARMADLPGWAEVNVPFEGWKASLREAT